jgi:hypothetical protein
LLNFDASTYITSADLYIRFHAASETTDASQSTYEIGAVYIGELIEYTLTVACPTGHGTPDPAVGTHSYWGAIIDTASVTPDSGYELDHWIETQAGTNIEIYHSSATVLLYASSDIQIDVYFRPIITGVPGFLIVYYDSAAGIWKPLSKSVFRNINEDIDGMDSASFTIPNTSANLVALNLDDVDADNVYIKILYSVALTEIFWGVVSGATLTDGADVECICYNATLYTIEQAPNVITADYQNVSVSYVISDLIRFKAGLPNIYISESGASTELETLISISFNGQNALVALREVCDRVGIKCWGAGSFNGAFFGLILYVGDRTATVQVPAKICSGGTHSFDRIRVKKVVIVKGQDAEGNDIQGIAGSNGAALSDFDMNATDVATLNSIAAKKLVDYNNPNLSISIPLLTSEAYAYHPGNYLTVSKTNLTLDDDYIIKRLTKDPEFTMAEIDVSSGRENLLLRDNMKKTESIAFKLLGVSFSAVQQCETPVFSPIQGTYTATQSVTITCGTSGASIYYTTDGSTPDSSDTLYSGAISVSSTTTLKAIAIKTAYTDSNVSTAVYTISTDENLAPFPGDVWDLTFGNPPYIVSVDSTVQRVPGTNSIKVAPHVAGVDMNGARETNTKWLACSPGDHIRFTMWAKTAALANTDHSTGARLGIDFYGNSGILDTQPHGYYPVGGVWYSRGNAHYVYPSWDYVNYQTMVDVALSQFLLPWNNDWTQLQWDVIVPSKSYTQTTSGTPCAAQQINGMIIWFDCRNVTDNANAWFSEPIVVKNPTT